MTGAFRWRSTLGASVALFLFWGTLEGVGWVVPWFAPGVIGFPRWLVLSAGTDAAYLGASPTVLIAREPAVLALARAQMLFLSGAVGSVGVAVAALAWFPLRRGERWALVTLGLIPLPTLALAGVVFSSYAARGASIGLSDIPPYLIMQTIVTLLGVPLGWVGLRHHRKVSA